MPKERKQTITELDKYSAIKLIENNIEPGDDGYIQYTNGYSDQKIADEFGMNVQNIMRWRERMFGRLKKRGGPNIMTQVWSRIHTLEGRVDSLEKDLYGSKPSSEWPYTDTIERKKAAE